MRNGTWKKPTRHMAEENGGIAARSLSSGLYRRFRICTGSVALLRFADFGSAACCSLSVTAGGELHPAPRPFFMNCIHFIPLGSVCQDERLILSFLLPPYISRPESRIFFFLSSFLSKKAGEKQDSRLCFDRLFTLYAVSYGQRSEYRAKGGRINESK